MRVALLQLALDPKSRAANVQRISAAIDAAAGADPSPDLLVLPGRCDTGGAVGGRGLHDASLTAVRERLAGKAREWGLFIAAGLHYRVGDSFESRAVLIDPDGDVAVQVGDEPSGAVATGSPSVRWWSTSIGRLGVFQVSETDAALPGTDGDSGPSLVAFPLAQTPGGRVGRSTASLLSRLRDDATVAAGVVWAIAAPAGADAEPRDASGSLSFVRAGDGSILAVAETLGEAIVHAEVPFTLR